MSITLLIIIVVLIFICILLTLKIYFIKKSIKEIIMSFDYILKTDTNNIITISSTDNYVKKLAINLNKELKELRTQKLQYQNGNQELENIITNISHDLRTPLTAISGYIELLEETLNEKQTKYIKVIHSKTSELILLTEQLFDFSKSLNSRGEIHKENCCINEILEETIVSYYKAFEEKNIVPNIEICEKKLYKNLDKTMLIRIFENLISNIIRYSDNDCNIKLQEDGKIIFFNKASKLDITTVKKIFDRYYTVENAKKNSGVGLSIVRQLVKMNDGNITAKYLKNILYIEIKW